MPLRYFSSLELQSFVALAESIPYEKIGTGLFPGIDLWVRRDDLIDPLISGNKAYKLIFNLLQARELGVDTLVTCGGAWSNHILATAAAGRRFGFQTIGIIRGERSASLSATLRDAERIGMELRFVSRQEYRRRNAPDFLQSLGLSSTEALYIPEGGANLAGVRGTQLSGEIIAKTSPVAFDQLWLACGTGATLAGVSSACGVPVTGVPVLKAEDSIRADARGWLTRLKSEQTLVRLCSGYDCGGYAKYPDYLREFHTQFERETAIPLDPVYTAKLAYALHRETETGNLRSGMKVLMLHSGGLQGGRGKSSA